MKRTEQIITLCLMCAIVIALLGCPGQKNNQTDSRGEVNVNGESISVPQGELPELTEQAGSGAQGENVNPPVTGYLPTEEQPLAPSAQPAPGAGGVPAGQCQLVAGMIGPDGNQVQMASGITIEAGNEIRVPISVVNNTDSKVEIVFATSQKLDIVATDASGNEVYRWSNGMRFPQVVNSLILEAGQTWSHELTIGIGIGERKIQPGTYNFQVIMPGTPTLTTAAENVTITSDAS